MPPCRAALDTNTFIVMDVAAEAPAESTGTNPAAGSAAAGLGNKILHVKYDIW